MKIHFYITEKCPTGSYGQDCRDNCSVNCYQDKVCNYIDGSCAPCKAGYKPPQCKGNNY